MENGTMYTDSSLRVMTGVNEQAASKDMYCDNWKSGVASMNVGTPLDTDCDWISCECYNCWDLKVFFFYSNYFYTLKRAICPATTNSPFTALKQRRTHCHHHHRHRLVIVVWCLWPLRKFKAIFPANSKSVSMRRRSSKRTKYARQRFKQTVMTLSSRVPRLDIRCGCPLVYVGFLFAFLFPFFLLPLTHNIAGRQNPPQFDLRLVFCACRRHAAGEQSHRFFVLFYFI